MPTALRSSAGWLDPRPCRMTGPCLIKYHVCGSFYDWQWVALEPAKLGLTGRPCWCGVVGLAGVQLPCDRHQEWSGRRRPWQRSKQQWGLLQRLPQPVCKAEQSCSLAACAARLIGVSPVD